jgi:hypothetical protein
LFLSREHVKLCKSRDIHPPFDFFNKKFGKQKVGDKKFKRKTSFAIYLLDLWGTTRGQPTAHEGTIHWKEACYDSVMDEPHQLS